MTKIQLQTPFKEFPRFAELTVGEQVSEPQAKQLVADNRATEVKAQPKAPADHIPAEPLAAAVNKSVQPKHVSRK